MHITFKSALLLLTMVSLTGRPVHAASIAIVNSSFENPALTFNSGTSLGDVPGWTASGFAHVAYGPVTVADGNNYLESGGAGHADQTLSVDLLANTVYTIGYYVGARSDFPSAAAYTLALEANNVVLNSGSDAYGGAPGGMEFKSFTYTSGAVVTAGQALQIVIDVDGSGGNGIYDLITLDASSLAAPSSAPEPASLALSISALSLLGWLRRRT